MKILFTLMAIAIISLYSCHKTSINKMDTGGWQLVQKEYSYGPSGLITVTPAADSSVLLQLNTDDTYNTKLNGQLISQGSASITVDKSYNNAQLLQLNNLATTGIFAPFAIDEVDSNGQITSSFTSFFITTDNSTLKLQTPYTPFGYTLYTFAKK